MTGDQIARSIYYGLWLVLVLSALFMRGMPKGKLGSLAAIWLVIILCLWTLITVFQKYL